MKPTRLHTAWPTLFLVGILCAPPAGASEIQATLERWIDTRKEIAAEETRWREEEDHLRRMRELLESELLHLDDSIARLESETAAQRRERERLSADTQSLETVTDGITERLTALEASLSSTYPRFPEPLRERTRPLHQRLRGEADGVPPIAQRLQTVVGLLGEADRFQENLHVTREVIALPEGETREVRTLYLGLGQAYYLSPDGHRAGVGVPDENGWEWSSRPELTSDIRRAFAIYDNEVAPDFVRLPVTLQSR